MTKKVRKNRYLFAGGGTGGHIFPGLAIADQLEKLDPLAEIHFVGTVKGLEISLVPPSGYLLHLIAVRGFSRSNHLANIAVVIRLLISLVQVAVIMAK